MKKILKITKMYFVKSWKKLPLNFNKEFTLEDLK